MYRMIQTYLQISGADCSLQNKEKSPHTFSLMRTSSSKFFRHESFGFLFAELPETIIGLYYMSASVVSLV